MLIRGEVFIPLCSTRSICETRSLTLCVCHWSRVSFTASTKLYVAKLITNSNPTVRCISINHVDDSTEQVWKCMHCVIITVHSRRYSECFVVYLCLSNVTTIHAELLPLCCQDAGKTQRLCRTTLSFVAHGIYMTQNLNLLSN